MRRLFLISLVLCLCLCSFYAGQWSVPRDFVKIVDEKCSGLDIPAKELERISNQDSEEIVGIREEPESKPSRFEKFRATVEVTTKEPKDVDYAKKQARELQSLLGSIPSVAHVEVLQIEGLSGDFEFTIQ